MAKELSASEVQFNLRGSRSAVSEEWFNGSPWMLESGVDFTGKASSFRAYVGQVATARGLSSRTKLVGEELVGEDILFQSYTPTAEESARKAASVAKRQATIAANKAAGKVRKSKKTATQISS